ncbi:XVIPCD domain-containing protein [Dyella tabacisoli]|uniref:Phospholipase n=1 Tax=Dyella tabacisoli TaxID=2282381 RepID=A0A369UPQ7_9GAMM|nr:XVIPCD domain-containing protein [Dyella tabacisoli]RDD80319.1 phospholipase [Dyella tabacisoli]
MPTATEHQQDRALLQQLRASGEPAKSQEAIQLQTLYHSRELGGLSADVYEAAKNSGHPPPGWVRASEHLDKLHAYAPQLNMSDAQLKEMLHPDSSGFRAEIYLPDSTVLGPGYKPVLAFKGSSGEVMTSHGLRDTTAEDFVANNFPQAAGLETDYYDRAMQLAVALKERGHLDFELTGHSLAGGMASAASAVTGMPATTYNAAGLHPITAQRFGEQNGLPVYDVSHRVTAYQVQGELLSNGVQDNIHRMDMVQRTELGGVLKETSQLLRELPEGRAMLKQALDKGVPRDSQGTVHAFVDKLATGDTDKMLRELPLAAGNVQPALAPMTRKNLDDPNSPLVARTQVRSLPEITHLAGPVMATMEIAALGAHVGERAGEAMKAGGQATQQGLHFSADASRTVGEVSGNVSRAQTHVEGAVVSTGVHVAGATLAKTREVGGEVMATMAEQEGLKQQSEASVNAALMRGVGSILPGSAGTWVKSQAEQTEKTGEMVNHAFQDAANQQRHSSHNDAAAIRGATHAAESTVRQTAQRAGDLQHDAMAGAGRVVGSGLDATGHFAEGMTRHAPTQGAMVGGVTAGTVAAAAQFNPLNPTAYPNLAKVGLLAAQGKQAGGEAFERHLMKASVLPSLDNHIEQHEQSARKSLQQVTPEHTEPAHQNKPAAARPRLDHPDHPDHALFKQARASVHQMDAEQGRAPDQRSENLAGALTVAAKAGGLKRVDGVVLSNDATRAFAAHHVIPRALTNTAHVEVTQAINTPLEKSTEAMHQLNQQQATQAQTQAQIQQNQQTQQSNGPTMTR